MNAPVSAHKPGSRLSELSPFEPEQRPQGVLPPRIPLPEPDYGCVEWFHYLEQLDQLGQHQSPHGS